MEQFEVYVESCERSLEQAIAFLDAFLPRRREVAEYYSWPELSGNAAREVFNNVETLLARLQQEISEEYGIYWQRAEPGYPLHAMLFFTTDGGMIAGLASANQDPATLLKKLAAFSRADFGMVVFEERPPSTLTEFRALCRSTGASRVVDGEFVPAS